MSYSSLNEFIKVLKKENEILEISEYIDTELEITEITDRISKSPDGGKALLFTNTKTNFPILINAFGSEKRMALALGVKNLDEIGKQMEAIFKELTSPKENILQKLHLLPQLSKIASWMPKKINGKGVCQEVIHKNPDLSILPILKTWPNDGGKFITLPCVNTIDPHTQIRNVGMYRMQVLDNKTTGMHWHKHKVGARHYSEYKKLGKKMPIAVSLGGDPAYTYSATAPLPDNVDEYMLAGFLRKKKVKLVRCITQDIYIPEDVDIVIEGYVDPTEDFIWEGPFGDHTGFYSLADWYPAFHVTCITHRKKAIYPTTIVGIPPMEDAYIGKATERIFLTPIKMTMLLEVLDMNLPFAGVAHNITIIKIDKTFAGQALKVMHSLWGAGQMMFNKMMIIVDKDVDVHNYTAVLNAVYKNVNPNSDIHFSKGPLDVLDHASDKLAFGSKMGIDATSKFPEELREEIVNNSTKNTESTDLQQYGIQFFAQDNKNFNLETFVQKTHSTLNKNTKFVIITDKNIDNSNIFNTVWTVANHVEPLRDSIVKDNIIYINGMSKNNKDFKRDWPNPVVMNSDTIKKIDNLWKKLKIGTFIPSPSLEYQKQMNGENAIANKNI